MKKRSSLLTSRKTTSLSILVKCSHPDIRLFPSSDTACLRLPGFAAIFSEYSIGSFLHDLYLICSREHGFRTLKVCVRGQQPVHEISISDHLKASGDHFGKNLVRLVLDSFDIVGPHGKHTCLVYQPLGMSFTEFQNLCPDNKLAKDLVQRSIQLILISLAFMHDNNVVHTG